MKTKILLIAFSAIFFQSCSKKGESVNPEAEPAPVTPTPIVYTKVFHDDFKDNSKNWFQKNNDTVYADIHSDFFFFTNNSVYPAYSVGQNLLIEEAKNFSIKASFNWLEGVRNYGYGLNWGKKDGNNRYSFLINNYNQFLVFYYKNGAINVVQDWTYSININSVSNILELRKEGNTLLFISNGVVLVKKPYMALFGNGTGFEIDNNIGISIDYIDVVQW